MWKDEIKDKLDSQIFLLATISDKMTIINKNIELAIKLLNESIKSEKLAIKAIKISEVN